MNKVLRMSLLALATVALMGSCKKKDGNEPTPTPAVPTTPASTITLTLPAGQEFALKGVEGENVTIGGVAVANYPYNSSNEPKVFTSQNGSVEIKGNVKSLTFSSGAFDKLEVPNGLETLRMLDGSKTASLDLSKAVSLKTLSLSSPSLMSDLDLRNNVNLKNITFSGGVNTGKTYLPTSVENLQITKHYRGLATEVTTANLPKLVRLAISDVSHATVVDLSGSTTITSVYVLNSQARGMSFANAKKLKTAIIYNSYGFPSVDLSGCSALQDFPADQKLSLSATGTVVAKLDNTRGGALTTLNLSGTTITSFTDKFFGSNPALATLDLSGSKVAQADFQKFPILKTIDLRNTAFTRDELTKALETLPGVNGTIKITGLSADDIKIITDKKWTIAQ